MTVDTHTILEQVLEKHANNVKWVGARFENVKRISNTLVGQAGQEFVELLCCKLGFECEFPEDKNGKRLRNSPWDIKIEGRTFEQKTASEDVSGAFQFNHIRYHRQYEALLCIGISPSDIHFGVWTKAEVTTGRAGNLVTMEKGANASYKLTKKPVHLRPISEFEDGLLDVLSKLED